MKPRVLLFVCIAALPACEDFYIGCAECAVDADCPEGTSCIQNGVGVPLRCIENEPVTAPPVGSCETPFRRVLPFSFEGDASALIDAHDISCSNLDVENGNGIAEIVFQIDIPIDSTLHVVANDSSGQGISIELLGATTCEGPVRACSSQANGIVDERMSGSGASFLVVERNPAGPFTLDVSLE